MFEAPERRLSASNSAVLASESFLVPMTLRSEARNSQAAFEGLHRAFDDVKGFVPALVNTAPGVSLIEFEAAVAPRVSRVDVSLRGKDHQFALTFALRCPIPKEQDFWARVRFVSAVYDRLSELVKEFENRKGITLYLETARLDQQKEDLDRMRFYKK